MEKIELQAPTLHINTHTPLNLSMDDQHLFATASSLTPTPVSLLRVMNAHILKCQIFTWKPLRFYTAYTNILPISKWAISKRLFRFFTTASTISTAIWPTDEWSAEYYHWFADALPRILAATAIVGNSCPVLLPAYYAERTYIPSSLAFLGLQAIYYNKGKQLQVKELILPSHTAPVGESHPHYMKLLREQFIQHKPTGQRKIYISREKAQKRKISNEQAVQTLVKQYGYEVHVMEDYSLTQQIEILSSANSVIGLHGAGLTNMLFMPAGSKVLEIRNEGDNKLNCFYYLASNLQHQYYYLTAKGDKADTYDVIVEVDVKKLEEVMKLMEK
ncbi:uncharacterized protein DUF563 [Chitinophaga skermanii]|uniref:Uncharacterized protein DUF563 n=1 Tax=Chitinophaga skermanii TaxID=331697 RepID=A0A327R367_9BACT|nr:glycosyltransferase family 61 protein [Chitinophaga skermanii]RAJ11091.1 uncharacterized protein DUF563 [Chitinophaga skermanii]